MKAIYIPFGTNEKDIPRINTELKGGFSIESEINVGDGTILIVNDITRKDKLNQILNNIKNE